MNFRQLAMITACAALLPAQSQKPNLSGRWEMVADKSSFGRMPAPKRVLEVITHKEPSLLISNTTEDGRGAMTSEMKLSCDNRENINVINGSEFRSKTRWEGDKLVIEVTGDRGMSMTEVRYLSADGKTQTVETYMGAAHGDPAMRRVMVRKGDPGRS